MPLPADARGRPYAYCSEQLAARGIDLAAENAPGLAVAAGLPEGHDHPHDAIIVPGYTPLAQTKPLALHRVARERLALAKTVFSGGLAPLIIVSGGNVHPEGTPYNEALEMKRHLLREGVPEKRILIEPCARHSHTNLRNAGRLLISAGLSRALIVTSRDQAFYFGHPAYSTFDARCVLTLGYRLGQLEPVGPQRVLFVPSGRVLSRGRDLRDP